MGEEPRYRTIIATTIPCRLRWFASLLGWNGLRLEWTMFSRDDVVKLKLPKNGLVYYMTTDLRFNLQINEFPIGQSEAYQATVKADRYGIRNVGWHEFRYFESDSELEQEADRLRPWLDRRHFKDSAWRTEFKKSYREMLLPSRKRRRGRRRTNVESPAEIAQAMNHAPCEGRT